MATHSSVLVWEIQQTEEPGLATVHGVTKSDIIHDLATKQQHYTVPSTGQGKLMESFYIKIGLQPSKKQPTKLNTKMTVMTHSFYRPLLSPVSSKYHHKRRGTHVLTCT